MVTPTLGVILFWFAVHWIASFLFLFIDHIVDCRVRHGYVDKDDLNEGLLAFFPAPVVGPFYLVYNIWCLIRWTLLFICNIGARNKK